jgi:uncharacterized protein YdiU (UPF0061 family)
MKHIKKYKDFNSINEEFDLIIGPIIGLALTSLLCWLGSKAFQIYDSIKLKKDFEDSGETEKVKIKYTISVSDYEKVENEGWFKSLRRKLGLKFKDKDVEEELIFNILKSKVNTSKFYSIRVKESSEETQSNKTGQSRVLVFNEDQFKEFKEKSKKIQENNPLDVLGTESGTKDIKTYTPLQFA